MLLWCLNSRSEYTKREKCIKRELHFIRRLTRVRILCMCSRCLLLQSVQSSVMPRLAYCSPERSICSQYLTFSSLQVAAWAMRYSTSHHFLHKTSTVLINVQKQPKWKICCQVGSVVVGLTATRCHTTVSCGLMLWWQWMMVYYCHTLQVETKLEMFRTYSPDCPAYCPVTAWISNILLKRFRVCSFPSSSILSCTLTTRKLGCLYQEADTWPQVDLPARQQSQNQHSEMAISVWIEEDSPWAQTKYIKDLERFCMEEWSKIPPNVFSNS